jgi:outer membrane receptor protein involved in Fe transport
MITVTWCRVLPSDNARDLFAFKLTWRMSANHSLSASVFGDPSEREGAFGNLASSPACYMRRRPNGSTDGAINYDGVFGQNVVFSARYATHNQRFQQEGPGKDLTGFSDFTDPFGTGVVPRGWDDRISGWVTTWEEDYQRQQYNADVTWFAGDLAGSHELKLGAEFEDLFIRDTWTRTGPYGTSVQRWPCNPGRQYCGEDDEHDYYYRHLFWISEEIDPYQATVDDVLKTRFVEAPTDKYAVYLRDRWQPVPDLTLNLGVRWSRQRLYNSDGDVQMDIDDQWAPRLGFVWDFLGNGKSKIFGHWGYFFESIPMQIVIMAFSGVEWGGATSNFSDDPMDLAHPPDGEAPRPPQGFGAAAGGFGRVDPSTRGQHISETVLGVEYEVVPDVALGLRFIRRNLARIIEDAIVSDHDFMIGNPGEGLLTHNWDFAWWYASYGYIDSCPDGNLDCHKKEMPRARREFTGVELTVHKRFSDNWQAIASLMWSRLEGSYDGNFQASTWQLSPNWNSAYDHADFSVNNEGLLSNDRPWQLKFDGIYRFDFGLSTGLSTYYRSGTPMTAMGYMDLYGGWEYYLSERGAFGRSDSEWEADIHFGYPIRLGAKLELNLLLDIFNVFNRQGETVRDTLYTDFYEDPAYQPLDWVTGVPHEPIEPGDVDRPPTAPTWNSSVFWQDPRTIRLGVRLSF